MLNNFHILHGTSIKIDGITFMGIGHATPITPFVSWSVDLSEENAYQLLSKPDDNFIFITHSPPFGFLDKMENNQHIGSKSIKRFIQESKPLFTVCGHIHECWNKEATIDGMPLINAGPKGYEFEY
ncbi:MAG: metallophosphoesterase [Desulfamplus sp.]|nr:metallophosphoesterase [Desulfamplus sp.]